MTDRSAAMVTALLRPEIEGLPAYDPGADPDDLARIIAPQSVVKLSNNENPLGMSPMAVEAIRHRLDAGMGRYPDPAGKLLTARLANRHGVDPRRIVLGNGSENILELLCQAFVAPGDTVATQTPCFGLHEIFPMMMGATVRKVALTPDFVIDTVAWQAALAGSPKLVFVSQPSNPAGVAFDARELTNLVEAADCGTMLVIDEAYYEYACDDPSYLDALELLRERDRPWIVLRTFSKAYGLAGLRIGYGVASHPELIDGLHRVRTPYNVNQLAQEAALAALDDRAHLERTVDLVRRERERVTTRLRDARFRVAPSLTNFLFIDTGRDAVDVTGMLRRSGIIVKAWREHGFERCVRMSLSLPGENDAFVDALLRIPRSSPIDEEPAPDAGRAIPKACSPT